MRAFTHLKQKKGSPFRAISSRSHIEKSFFNGKYAKPYIEANIGKDQTFESFFDEFAPRWVADAYAAFDGRGFDALREHFKKKKAKSNKGKKTGHNRSKKCRSPVGISNNSLKKRKHRSVEKSRSVSLQSNSSSNRNSKPRNSSRARKKRRLNNGNSVDVNNESQSESENEDCDMALSEANESSESESSQIIDGHSKMR